MTGRAGADEPREAGPILVEERGEGVRLIAISRPARRNALDERAFRTLAAALSSAATDDGVRALALTGAGGVFTSGADLVDFQLEAGEGALAAAFEFLNVLRVFPKPLLAAVEGFAVGVGTTLLLHCDFAYAKRGARFRLPFVPLGLCPEGGSSLLLPRVAGAKRAAELLMLGEPFGAHEAAEAGLVTGVVADGEALGVVLEKATRLASMPPAALAATKALLRRGLTDEVASAMRREAEAFDALRGAPCAQAAFKAFFAKTG